MENRENFSVNKTLFNRKFFASQTKIFIILSDWSGDFLFQPVTASSTNSGSKSPMKNGEISSANVESKRKFLIQILNLQGNEFYDFLSRIQFA